MNDLRFFFTSSFGALLVSILFRMSSISSYSFFVAPPCSNSSLVSYIYSCGKGIASLTRLVSFIRKVDTYRFTCRIFCASGLIGDSAAVSVTLAILPFFSGMVVDFSTVRYVSYVTANFDLSGLSRLLRFLSLGLDVRSPAFTRFLMPRSLLISLASTCADLDRISSACDRAKRLE